jgi:anthranilate synthase component I
MYTPTSQDFSDYAARGTLVPVYRELPSDLETPVSAFMKLRGDGPAFLLESAETNETWGRYSILGVAPERQIIGWGKRVELHGADGITTHDLQTGKDPLTIVEDELAAYRTVEVPGLPPFFGGAVGFMGYDLVSSFEPVLDFQRAAKGGLPDMHLLLASTLVIFDHFRHSMLVIANAYLAPGVTPTAAYQSATRRIESIVERLRQPLPAQPVADAASHPVAEFRSSTSQEQFEGNVRRAKEHIGLGNIYQVVLSQRLSRRTSADPLTIYRVLRRINPSPYMFFFEFPASGDRERVALIGASPEVLVRLVGRSAVVRPLAGTRPRGRTPEEDEQLEAELLADPKERAEHVMLVDLERNDLGRVSEPGTVRVDDLMVTERYSHVMHIVSEVTGQLRADRTGFDLFRAVFPVGTVSGAPKIRAMQIIEELEGLPRGPYAGGVGYFGYNGNVDTCIAIRTAWMVGDTAFVQAGAGIVADSDPTTEWHETMHKARALGVAIDLAEKGL